MNNQEFSQSNSPRQMFGFSCLLLMYFLGLLVVNYAELDFVLIGVVIELVTIPALLAVVGFTVYNAYLLFRRTGSNGKWHLYSLVVLLVTIGLLGMATFLPYIS